MRKLTFLIALAAVVGVSIPASAQFNGFLQRFRIRGELIVRAFLVAAFIFFALNPAQAAVTSAAVDSTPRTGSTSTTSTITGVTFGTAFSGRVVVVFLFSNSGNSPTAVTIAGVAANVTAGNLTGLFIASAVVSTGTSGSVVATFASSDTMHSVGAIALTGAASAVPSASNNIASGSNTIAVQAGGSVAAFANTFPGTTAGTWTGVTSIIAYSATNASEVGSLDNSGGAIPSLTVSYSTGAFLNLAAFSPAASITEHNLSLMGVGH